MTRCYLTEPLLLEDGGPMGAHCCCNCRWHATVNHHCTTQPRPVDANGAALPNCVCATQKARADGGKNFACLWHVANWSPGEGRVRVHDNWPEHSYGCECYEPRKKIGAMA